MPPLPMTAGAHVGNICFCFYRNPAPITSIPVAIPQVLLDPHDLIAIQQSSVKLNIRCHCSLDESL